MLRVTRNREYRINNGKVVATPNVARVAEFSAGLPLVRRPHLTDAQRIERKIAAQYKRARMAAKVKKAEKMADIEGWQMQVPVPEIEYVVEVNGQMEGTNAIAIVEVRSSLYNSRLFFRRMGRVQYYILF